MWHANIDHETGWRLWLTGLTEHKTVNPTTTDTITQPICPFKYFKPSLLPMILCHNYKLDWHKFFSS